MTSFVHLQVHSEYSLVDGLARIKPLIAAVREKQMPAIALTEQGNLFSLVKFYSAAVFAGIKPIIGADVWVLGPADQRYRLTLLCQDNDGYRRLTALLSKSYVEGQRNGVPTILPEWLHASGGEGLIALSGGAQGQIGRALQTQQPGEAARFLDCSMALFPDRFYVDVQRLGRAADDELLYRTVELALAHDAPLVATNDVRFVHRSDFAAHEARVCIQDGRRLADPRRPRRYSEEQYLRGPEEMATLFADLPSALENTVEIAKRCNVELTLGQDVLPDFPIPGEQSVDDYFSEQSRCGLDQRLSELFEDGGEIALKRPPYDERLNFELDVIMSMGFAGYYLIVADFTQWARNNGVPVGPGRGSGAGSLVAYALGITDLDPIGYDLLFERFLNPERVSMPDFDIDFCMDGRDRVIEYVSERYGAERVSQIITFGTMAARAVVRDVGRVLGQPYGFVDQIAKLIPFEIGVTLEKALQQEEVLRSRYESEEEVKTLIDLARSLEGLARNAGKHAGGVVIAPGPLTDFTPLYCEQGGTSLVTQLDKDDVAAVGLVKFDFLGLRTLTIIDRALKTINAERCRNSLAPLSLKQLDVEDQRTFELIRRGATTAVFQLESRGMRDLIRRLQPDRFEEIIALVALFRPGPLQSGMVEDFIERKHGRAKVLYPHPELAPILASTYGVILYQEQVMQIARVLAGYSLGGADILRKAMGKKQPAEMAKQRAVFLAGARERGVELETASGIFDLMEKFAGYGFNRSHSAAYALIAYHTAWLKAHHPAAFMAAVLSSDMDHTDKIVVFIDECREMGLKVEPPDVNRCQFFFTAEGEGTIRYGLGAIKGVGQAAIESIVDEREEQGPFRDLFDFCRRVDHKKINRRVLEAMIRSGALDGIGPGRATLMHNVTPAMQAAEQYGQADSAGQDDMFGEATPLTQSGAQYVEVVEWDEPERLRGEKDTLGLYLTGHPVSQYLGELSHFTAGRLAETKPAKDQTQVVAGLVIGLRALNSRKGRMAVATLDDGSGRMEIVVYSDVFQQYRDLLVKDELLVAQGEVGLDEMTGVPSMTVQAVYDIQGARSTFARRIAISVDQSSARNGFVDALANVLEPHCAGTTPVCINYCGADAKAGISLGHAWRVTPCDELLLGLKELAGAAGVDVVY